MTLHLDILRTQLHGTGTFGDLSVDGEFLCHTCEHTQFALPEGDYELLPHDSQAHPGVVAFHNPALGIYAEIGMIPAGQQGRSECLIHPANWPAELLGCVAPGIEIESIPPNGWGVSSSREAFDMLASRWGNRSGLTATIRSAQEQTS